MRQEEASEWRPVACLNQERLLGGGENVLGTLDGGMPCLKVCRSIRQSSTEGGGYRLAVGRAWSVLRMWAFIEPVRAL